MNDQELILAMVTDKLQDLGYKHHETNSVGTVAMGRWSKGTDKTPPWLRMNLKITVVPEIGTGGQQYILEIVKRQGDQAKPTTRTFDYHNPDVLDQIEEWIKPYDRGYEGLRSPWR